MIETNKKQSQKVAEIVICALEQVKFDMMQEPNRAGRREAAKVIAELAHSLDTRPHVCFTDINSDEYKE